MSETARHQTIQTPPQNKRPGTGMEKGQLLQIHPVDLERGLITLDEKPLVVGREAGADLIVAEKAISRRHARFERTAAGFKITDLGSTNGTWVNEKRITMQLLMSGDRIRIGGRIFKFMSTDAVEAQYHEVVYSMMTKDSLTGAWNKRYLMDILTRELRRRQRTQRPLSMIMIDIDYFKQINDGHGHLVGDNILREVATRIGTAIRDEDIFARFGGEEFCVLLSDTTKEEALAVAERCRLAVFNKPFEIDSGVIDCTISSGIGFLTGDTKMTTEELLQEADDKLYLAKSLGRNQVQS